MSKIVYYPAMRAKLGNTEYYTFVVKARDLAASARLTSPDDWKNIKVEEKWQRKLDWPRVVKHLAPYLAANKSRFFGAVTVATDQQVSFTPFQDLLAGSKLNPLYKPIQGQLASMGLLTLEGGEEWNPLDGQHRIAAIRCAITGKDNRDKVCAHFTPSRDLGDEDITVIMIPGCNTAKARKIFIKINQNARKTKPGENLMMDDDDIIAVLSREVADEFCGGGDLVVVNKNDIGDNEPSFTTLKAIEQMNADILQWCYGQKIDRKELPHKDVQQLLRSILTDKWSHLIQHIRLFQDALSDKGESGDKKRTELRKSFLLLKPVPQVSLVAAFARLTGSRQNGQPLTNKAATDRLNKIDWQKDAVVWDRVLMSGGKILPKKGNLATDLIYYMAGGKLNDGEEENLLKRYRQEFYPAEGWDKKQLPPKVE